MHLINSLGKIYIFETSFWVSLVPDILYRVISRPFEHTENVVTFPDDILICGDSPKHLSDVLQKGLDKAGAH